MCIEKSDIVVTNFVPQFVSVRECAGKLSEQKPAGSLCSVVQHIIRDSAGAAAAAAAAQHEHTVHPS